MTRPCILLTVLLAFSACGATSDDAAVTTGAISPCPASVPDPILSPPAGNRVLLSTTGEGVQAYACARGASGAPAWAAAFPEADLSVRGVTMVGRHFIGPSWEALDRSVVVGTKVAALSVDPTAVPWLLLARASGSSSGLLSLVTFIQRLETSGGLQPDPAECGEAQLGTIRRVPYSATYLFWRTGAGPGPRCGN